MKSIRNDLLEIILYRQEPTTSANLSTLYRRDHICHLCLLFKYMLTTSLKHKFTHKKSYHTHCSTDMSYHMQHSQCCHAKYFATVILLKTALRYKIDINVWLFRFILIIYVIFNPIIKYHYMSTIAKELIKI